MTEALAKTALGGMIGVTVNTGINFLIHGGSVIEQSKFDPTKASVALGTELAVSLMSGIVFNAGAGVISALSAIALFSIDALSPRAPVAIPTAPKPGQSAVLTTQVQNVVSKLPAAVQPAAAKVASPIESFFTSLFSSTPKPAAVAPQNQVKPTPVQSSPTMITSYDQLLPAQPKQAAIPDGQFVTSLPGYAPTDAQPSQEFSYDESDYTEGMAGANRHRNSSMNHRVMMGQPALMVVRGRKR